MFSYTPFLPRFTEWYQLATKNFEYPRTTRYPTVGQICPPRAGSKASITKYKYRIKQTTNNIIQHKEPTYGVLGRGRRGIPFPLGEYFYASIHILLHQNTPTTSNSTTNHTPFYSITPTPINTTSNTNLHHTHPKPYLHSLS